MRAVWPDSSKILDPLQVRVWCDEVISNRGGLIGFVEVWSGLIPVSAVSATELPRVLDQRVPGDRVAFCAVNDIGPGSALGVRVEDGRVDGEALRRHTSRSIYDAEGGAYNLVVLNDGTSEFDCLIAEDVDRDLRFDLNRENISSYTFVLDAIAALGFEHTDARGLPYGFQLAGTWEAARTDEWRWGTASG